MGSSTDRIEGNLGRLGQSVGRYAVAAGIIVSAALLCWAWPNALGRTPYLAFYPAVMAAAGFGGLGPGVLSTLLSVLAVDLFFDSTPGRVTLIDRALMDQLAMFLAGGLSISVVTGMQRTARRRERQQAGALQISEAQYRGTFENAAVGIAHVDAKGRWLRVNPRLCQMLGYREDELIGGGFIDITHPDDREADLREYYALFRGTVDSHAVEKRYIGKDRQVMWARVTRSGQRAPNGEVTYCIAIIEDIRQRKRAEEELGREQAFLRSVIDTAPSLVFVKDGEGRFVLANQALARCYGSTVETVVGKTDADFNANAEEVAHFIADDRDVIRTRQPKLIPEEKLTFADGQQHWVSTVKVPLLNPDGTCTTVLCVASDISERKRSEEMLTVAMRMAEQAKATAEEASRAKGHFLAVLSHELRTPLTPVMAGVALLRERVSSDGSGDAEILEMIRRNVEMEARLIDDLLDVTRIERGKIELKREAVELAEVIARSIEVCRPDLEARGLHLGVDRGPGPYWVKADVSRLQQVFWNLLKNAIKFSPHGTCIGVRCRSDGTHAVVEVIDSGIGIEAEHLPRLFAAFEQADRSITRQFGGLGLGLAISKTLVDLHGGRIEACSEGKGKGATFRVCLPLVTPPGKSVPTLPARPQGRSRPLHILLVEDHGDTARMMQRILRMDGHAVEMAGDVASAMDLLDRSDFDMVVSDLGLPDGSGLDIVRNLRQHGRPTPAIALSGYGQDQDISRSKEAGFAEHLTKPVDPTYLRGTIRRLGQEVR
jgi:two-component system, chemotaxis family, CheB/CheR fusion protein